MGWEPSLPQVVFQILRHADGRERERPSVPFRRHLREQVALLEIPSQVACRYNVLSYAAESTSTIVMRVRQDDYRVGRLAQGLTELEIVNHTRRVGQLQDLGAQRTR